MNANEILGFCLGLFLIIISIIITFSQWNIHDDKGVIKPTFEKVCDKLMYFIPALIAIICGQNCLAVTLKNESLDFVLIFYIAMIATYMLADILNAGIPESCVAADDDAMI